MWFYVPEKAKGPSPHPAAADSIDSAVKLLRTPL